MSAYLSGAIVGGRVVFIGPALGVEVDMLVILLFLFLICHLGFPSSCFVSFFLYSTLALLSIFSFDRETTQNDPVETICMKHQSLFSGKYKKIFQNVVC